MKLRHGEIKIDASAVRALLAAKHASDVFVPECKDGPTQGSTHFRLDAWAMLRSWSNPLTVGYEIKVSRADFLKDGKWQAYLPLCSEFNFVCPQGLILPDELPPEVGLLYVTATGTRLFTKKKAQRRNVEIPENLWRYILMCRAKIKRTEYSERNEDTRQQWRDWLAKKVEDRELGYRVSHSVRATLETRTKAIEAENRLMKQQMESYDRLRKWLVDNGIEEGCHNYFDSIKSRMEKLRSIIPPDLKYSVGHAIRQLKDFQEEIEHLLNPAKPELLESL